MWLVAGTEALSGAVDGVNRTFVVTAPFNAARVQVAINGLLRLPGGVTDNGYTLAGRTLTLGEAPVPRDVVALWAEPQGAAPIILPPPPTGAVLTLMPPTGSVQPDARLVPQGEVSTMQPASGGPTGSVRLS